MASIKKHEPAVEVISHDVAPLTVNTDAGAYAKVGWIVVLVGVLGFLLWASIAPLDKGVPLSGTVAKEGNRKAIQSQTGGIVQDILVRDGDHVKAGQVLVMLNDVQAKSAMDVTRAQYISARATEARLLAELSGKQIVVLPPALEKFKDEPRVAEALLVQRELLVARRSALEHELGAADESIAGLSSQLQGTQQSRESKKLQLGLLKEQLDNTRDLARDGYIARNRLLDLERSYAQVDGAISEDVGNIGRIQRQIQELKMRKIQRAQEYQKEVRTQLSDIQKEADALMGRISGQEFELASVALKSPVDGVVVGSSVFTRGGVVSSGAHLMEIVPANDALVVEGELAVNLIDKVRPGLPVELHFSAFNTNKTPHIPGTITQVAADRTVNERTGQSYYKVRATVSADGAKLIAKDKLDIISGMPVDMFIKTGERTMMSYLLKPIVDRAQASMSEE